MMYCGFTIKNDINKRVSTQRKGFKDQLFIDVFSTGEPKQRKFENETQELV